MKLPEIQLDDRRFQDLVSEARLKITRACPEWTEHNVSDPGITLIELFAWMTEMTIYRLNRVPDKLHVALLELLGHPPRRPERGADEPALPARRSRPREPLRDPRRRDRGRDAADGDRGVDRLPGRRGLRRSRRAAGRLRAPARRPGQEHRRSPTASPSPSGADQLAFANPPAVGDALYLGFEEPLGRPADRGRRRRLAGARRRREPRGPAAALGGLPGRRRVARGRGARGPHRRLQLRLGHRRARAAAALGDPAAGRPPHALAALPDRRQDPPRRRRDHLLAAARDLLDHRRRRRLPAARHARVADHPEILGVSDGTPGQIFPLRNAPVLKPMAGRDARGPGPRVRRLGALGAARRLRRLDRVRPPLQPRRRLGRDRVRPRDPRDRRRLDAVRRRPAQGRGAALHPLPPRRRAAWATSPPGR